MDPPGHRRGGAGAGEPRLAAGRDVAPSPPRRDAVAGITIFNAVGFYLMFLYVVTWLQTVDGVAPARAP